jgi:Holliday junction resolvasome RuvABC endonuclease subunit
MVRTLLRLEPKLAADAADALAAALCHAQSRRLGGLQGLADERAAPARAITR